MTGFGNKVVLCGRGWGRLRRIPSDRRSGGEAGKPACRHAFLGERIGGERTALKVVSYFIFFSFKDGKDWTVFKY